MHQQIYETFCSDSINDLAKAMLQVQKELPAATRDARNPFVGSSYASLNSVLSACRPVLVRNGIWCTQTPIPVEQPGCIGLLTKLVHAESGQFQASLTVLPLQKNDCQGAGSAITYARRYALTAMLGMVTEEDDDGEGSLSGTRRDTRMNVHPQTRQRQDEIEPVDRPASQTRPDAYAERSESQGNHADMTNLPELPGVRYGSVRGSDGHMYITATGATRPCRETLRGLGFRWDMPTKSWWRPAV